MKKTLVLIVLDGWGIGPDEDSNPAYAARLQHYPFLCKNFPLTSLEASGISVGLPWGETGNSEVGHLTMGAGKIIYQHFPRISLSIRDRSFFQNQILKNAFAHAKKNNSAVNLVGLLSKGNTHASIEHLLALLDLAKQEQCENLKLHLFADGKDAPPHTLEALLAQVPQEKIATLMGRYYAMDREQNWHLTKTAYNTLIGSEGTVAENPAPLIAENYKLQPSEEYLPPIRLNAAKKIEDNDAIIFFNFREDSIRQLSEAFLLPGFNKFPLQPLKNLHIATFTRYEEKFAAPVAFPEEDLSHPLGEAISSAGLSQLRLAETYKYAHVTYFFNGYRETPFKNEYRVLIPSLQTPHPDEHPEMMAPALTDRLLQAIEGQAFEFILVNYANPDTIGHTGNYDAGIRAAQAIDKELGRILKTVEATPTTVVLTADHGNIERMFNPATGRAETQHDPNPVPFILISSQFKGRSFYNTGNIRSQTSGSLADVAPTVLELLGVPVPPDMNGQSLLKSLL